MAIDPPQWSEQQLEAERHIAITNFRRARTAEPLEDYLEAFDRYQGIVEELLEISMDLSRLEPQGVEILSRQELLEIFRYLAGPPISLDDLKTLADAGSLTAQTLRNNKDLVARLIDVIRATLDRRRFPWVSENREPTDVERSAAVLASASLLASSRTATARRNLGVMPIECKVSNSSTNSVKRLNNDAAAKAEVWVKDFGTRQVVPTAILSGVYKLHNLMNAQSRGLTLFWAHQLEPMKDWIDSTRAK